MMNRLVVHNIMPDNRLMMNLYWIMVNDFMMYWYWLVMHNFMMDWYRMMYWYWLVMHDFMMDRYCMMQRRYDLMVHWYYWIMTNNLMMHLMGWFMMDNIMMNWIMRHNLVNRSVTHCFMEGWFVVL